MVILTSKQCSLCKNKRTFNGTDKQDVIIIDKKAYCLSCLKNTLSKDKYLKSIISGLVESYIANLGTESEFVICKSSENPIPRLWRNAIKVYKQHNKKEVNNNA